MFLAFKFHYLNILRSAKSEQTRIRFSAERLKLASDKNVPLLKKIIQLRALIANKIGYKTWADYRCEVKMAGDGKTASDFLINLKRGLESKWKAEMAEFTKIKRRETNDSDAVVNMWDIFYYENLYKKERFSVDAEQLRVFFPYEQTLQGMFRVYEEIFRLKIVEAKPQYKWNNQVTLHLVYDSLSGEPLGALYLDMFPRDGKFNHFAMFPLISGKKLSSGHYQRPTVALICNFPNPGKDKTSLLSHDNVETLFHEFGHALHGLLANSKYSSLSGTSVLWDFVELPSQLYEHWLEVPEVLNRFAVHYQTGKPIPDSLLKKILETRNLNQGFSTVEYVSSALVDLSFHENIKEIDPLIEEKRILDKLGIPSAIKMRHSTPNFSHIFSGDGYSSGYYSYMWSEVMDADAFKAFVEVNDPFDPKTAERLLSCIYSAGGSRPPEELYVSFRGSLPSVNALLEQRGLDI
mgnify:CR=1 FL=1